MGRRIRSFSGLVIGIGHAVPAMLFLVGVLSLAQSPAWADPPSYRAEVIPPLEGHDSALPNALDESGVIVGYAAPLPIDPNSVAAATTGDTLVELPAMAKFWNRAQGVNDFDIVVGMSDFRPHKWVGGVGSLLATPIGYFSGLAWDVNNGGMVVGNYINDLIGFDAPFYWPTYDSDAVMLPGLNGFQEGAAFAVNDAGQVAGVVATGGPFLGARWDDPTLEPVLVGPLPGALGGELRAINSQGDTAGRSTFPGNEVHALLHIMDTNDLIDLGVLGGAFPFSEAFGVNDQRQVVGATSTDTLGHGFLWQEGTMHDLNDLIVTTNEPFAYISGGMAINNLGQIAAEAVMGEEFKAPHRMVLLSPCAPADFACDGDVGPVDLAQLLVAWGPCGDCDDCPQDLNGDCTVGPTDLGMLLVSWGPFP